MKIKAKENLIKFDELFFGDVFNFDGEYYMKIENVNSSEGKEYNCVYLSDGTLYYCDKFDQVNLVTCTLVLE